MSIQHVAVIGSGIAGLSAAWLLSKKHHVTLYESADYLGGHTHTVDVTVDGERFPVDTGFLVFNDRTYPNLCGLFEHLNVDSVASDMSFSVRLTTPDLEWSGTSLATLFGQKRNLLRPGFWRIVSDILRFNQASVAWLEEHPHEEGPSLGAYLTQHNYSEPFRDWYLLPMAAAIWSCPTGQMLDYPFATFVRFCRNHGLLQINDRPQWRTVRGGGREYVKLLAAGISRVRLSAPVQLVHQLGSQILVSTPTDTSSYDRVVLACHTDDALRLLGHQASDDERSVLSAVRYQMNRAVLHTDRAVLPRDPALWSAWNYRAGRGEPGQQPVSVTYLINQLQPLPVETPVMVTLNPDQAIDPSKVLQRFDYAHPVFDGPAIAAQQRLSALQGQRGIYFCGAWAGYGFHEDGLKAGMAVAEALDCRAPWVVGKQHTSANAAPMVRAA